MRRILYLWVQHLHTQMERQWDAALRGQPVVVAAGRFQRGTVLDASPEAEAMGVAAGMTWRHAHRRCPTARFIRYERPRYAPVIEQIGAVITRCTPWAELMPGTEDEFFVDLGAGDLTDGARLVQRLQADLAAELRLETRAALASGKFPARTLCREAESIANCKLQIANCQLSRPNPQGGPTNPPSSDRTPLHDGTAQFAICNLQFAICNAFQPGLPTVREALKPLSIDCLWELKPEVRERMRLLGIRTLGQLAAVPQRLLVEQFGPAGRWYRLLARGIDHRRVAAWQPSPSMGETRLVLDDEPALPLLEEILADLAGRLSERLLRAGLSARTVTLVAHLEGGDRLFATHHLKAPAHLRRRLFETAAALLGRIVEREEAKDIANCKLQIANCELSRPGAEGGAESPPSHDPATLHAGTVQFAICNLQFAICNVFPLAALELHVGGLGARGVLQLSIFGEADRGPALRAAVARIQDRFGERAVRNAIQLLAELR